MVERREKPKLSAEAVRRLSLARYYLTLAKEHARIDREADAFVAINLLHEALETFLVAACEHLNVAIKSRTEFVTYLDKLDGSLAPRRLPFRTALIRLNKARVSAKHDSIVPDRAEIPTFAASAGAFLEEAAELVFELSFSTVSLVDLLDEGPSKEHLRAAQNALEEARFVDVLQETRKALYLTFEKQFDVSAYAFERNVLGLFSLMCRAPSYVRSKEYIEANVNDPFDYIVLDHAQIDTDLIKDGLDPQIFWNLWRLTPAVFQTSKGQWMIKHELDKIGGDAPAENAAYVLENAINLLHQSHRKRRNIRTPGSQRWSVGIKGDAVKVYKKASLGSEVLGVIPKVETLDVLSATPSFEGDRMFWKISYIREDEPVQWLRGYVDETDLSFD